MLNIRRNTRLVTLSAVLTAAGVALIYLTAAMPTLQLAITAVAGMLAAIPLLLGGIKWCFLTYAATGLLALVLGIDKEAALFYLVLFGHWPVLKSIFEQRIRSAVLLWAVKLAVCNLLFLLLWLLVRLLSIDLGELGMPVWLFLIAGNVAFVLYDHCFTLLVRAFGARLMKYKMK